MLVDYLLRLNEASSVVPRLLLYLVYMEEKELNQFFIMTLGDSVGIGWSGWRPTPGGAIISDSSGGSVVGRSFGSLSFLGKSRPYYTTVVRFPRIASAIEESIVWDGVYFVRIAECGGYEYEQSYAFLPLLIISISFLSTAVFAPLIPHIGHRAVLGLSGYVLNNVAFLFAAVYL
ncbi:hypothetical protein LguiA_007674 [Lonicera macranthoides]